jgi:hypothetical protein
VAEEAEEVVESGEERVMVTLEPLLMSGNPYVIFQVNVYLFESLHKSQL